MQKMGKKERDELNITEMSDEINFFVCKCQVGVTINLSLLQNWLFLNL